MKKQSNQNLPVFTAIILSSVLLFNAGCSKEIKRQTPAKPITGNSEIVYTDLNPDSVIISSSRNLYNLDLNNDGISDFAFKIDTLRFKCGETSDPVGGWGSNPFQTIINLSSMPANENNAIMISGSNFILALDSSAVITPDTLWATTSRNLLGGPIGSSSRCGAVFPAYGNWLNVADKYLGLKFVSDNNTYYGWARLSSSYSANTLLSGFLIRGELILKDYAYNSIPNQPIFAGQKK